MSRGVNLPGSSIIVFDMPDKIILTGKEDELCAKKLKVVTEALNEFLKEDDKVVCFLPDDLNLLFFYKGTTDAIDISLTGRHIHIADSEEDTGDTRLTSGDSEGGEDAEDDYE
jgi:uncharacterized protein (UPF0371 family)